MNLGHFRDSGGKPKFSAIDLESFECEPITQEEFEQYLTEEERKCLDDAFEARKAIPWDEDANPDWLESKKAEMRDGGSGMDIPEEI